MNEKRDILDEIEDTLNEHMVSDTGELRQSVFDRTDWGSESEAFPHPRYNLVHESVLSNEDQEAYYNIENTENPYILKYTKSSVENLSNRFVKQSSNIWNIPSMIYTDKDIMAYITNTEALDSLIVGYKESLAKNRTAKIVNLTLLNSGLKKETHYTNQLFANSIKSYFNANGLTFNIKTGRISIKRKESIKKVKINSISKSEINNHFRYLLSRYSQILDMDIVFKITSKNLYNTLVFFQAGTPKISYEELVKDGYSEFKEECKKIWNTPKILISQPKGAKKSPSSKGTI